MLKRYITVQWLIAILLLAVSCKKETTDDVSTVVKVSYPSIELTGDPFQIVPLGGTYTEEGATLTDDVTGETSTIQPTSGTVNTSEPGLYVLNYAASNANGFETVASRVIAVPGTSSGLNWSGNYLRPQTGITATVTRLQDGVYEVLNPGGAGVGTGTIVYFVEVAPNEFVAPPQPTDAGTMEVTDIEFTESGASWRVLNALYGTAIRNFIKQ